MSCLSDSLAELEKEVHNIKSGLKALEAVSCCVLVIHVPSHWFFSGL